MLQFYIQDNCKVLSAEPTGCNSTWYVGYEFESDVQEAMDHLRNTRPNLKVYYYNIPVDYLLREIFCQNFIFLVIFGQNFNFYTFGQNFDFLHLWPKFRFFTTLAKI